MTDSSISLIGQFVLSDIAIGALKERSLLFPERVVMCSDTRELLHLTILRSGLTKK